MTESGDTTVSENQRLRKEVRDLRARVAAFESSRWWRLHPRRLLAGLHRTRSVSAPREEERKPVVEDDTVTVRFRAEVLERGRFTEDWFTVHVPAWERVLAQRPPAHVLELGSFEGLSACFLLWRLPDAQLTCVDTFAGLSTYSAYGIATAELEEAFDHNVALVDGSRVRKIVGKTQHVLPALVDEEQRYDLVYVDASHTAFDVLVDVALAWQLLVTGGIAVFDDYGPIPEGEDALAHPTPAIDAFLQLVSGRYEVVDDERQLIVRKTA